MQDYFVSRKIQVTFKAPNYFQLLNPDGSLNEGADMIFTIYAQMAEAEMRTKKERFKRSKDARKKQGYYIGGYLLYGYAIAEDKKIVPHPVHSEIVKNVYGLYLSGKYSIGSLAKELQANGLFTDTNFDTLHSFLLDMISNTAYAGVPPINKKGDSGYSYPPLVSLEMVERCKAIAEGNKTKPKKVFSEYYFGKGILRCPVCGKVMSIGKRQNRYRCLPHMVTANVNMVDSALWYVASQLYKEKMRKKDDSDKKYYEEQIEVLTQKIEVAKAEIKAIEARADKIEYKAFVEGTMDIAKAESYMAELKKKIGAKNKEIETYNTQIIDFQNLLMDHTDEYAGVAIDELDYIKDDKIKYEIIHQMISWAVPQRLNNQKKVIISIYDYKGEEHKYLLDTYTHRIYRTYTDNGIGLEEVKNVFQARFTFGGDVNSQEKQKEYLKQYRKRQKEYDNDKVRIANAERQRRYREKKKAKEKGEETN